MTIIDREEMATHVRQSTVLQESCQTERQLRLAEQLVANAETKRRWLESNPIEVSQSQLIYNANA